MHSATGNAYGMNHDGACGDIVSQVAQSLSRPGFIHTKRILSRDLGTLGRAEHDSSGQIALSIRLVLPPIALGLS
jgi:hypothetical protein